MRKNPTCCFGSKNMVRKCFKKILQKSALFKILILKQLHTTVFFHYFPNIWLCYCIYTFLNKGGVFVTISVCLLRWLDYWLGQVTTPLKPNWTPGQCSGGCWHSYLSCSTVQFSAGISQFPLQYFGVECCTERDTISCRRGGTTTTLNITCHSLLPVHIAHLSYTDLLSYL